MISHEGMDGMLGNRGFWHGSIKRWCSGVPETLVVTSAV